MRAWLLFLAVLATFKPIIQVASTEENVSNPVINRNSNTEDIRRSNDIESSSSSSSHSKNSIINNNSNSVSHKKNHINSNNNMNNNINTINNSDSDYSNLANIKSDHSDDNISQTPDPQTLVEIESSLLTLFGLKRPPKIDRSKIIIPEAMKQLYAQIMGHEYDSVAIPKPGLYTKTANTVRSFTHEESSVDHRFQHNHRFRLYFNLKSIPTEEKLKAAELTLNREAITEPGADRTRYQILVYDILQVGIKGKSDPSYFLIDTKTIWINSSETISLDVQPAAERWLANPKGNHGLLIEVRTPRKLKPAKHHHVRLRRSVDEAHEEWAHKQPLLLTYTDDGRHKSRSIRDVTRSKRAHRKSRRKDGREICQRKPLFVDFGDVGWTDWIVAPPGYDAFYCHGDCPLPIPDHLNTTNHAVVQNLVNNINPAKVPKACCVPTQLTAISMLYLNDQNTVVLKNYQDMAVVGCGCR